ncbi:UNVERIFIED_CONTAM: hypothetical protein NY100_04865 [Prevotella sp. 15_C9]
MNKKAFFLTTIFLFYLTSGYACTAAVVTGKVTADGRPLLWKVRDTDNLQNSIKFFNGTKYNFFGIVDCNARSNEEIWMGTNTAGFSIMNTQSFNLEETINGVEPGDKNGNFMFRALNVCATVDELKNFLDTTSLKGLCANFGVIDARGGAGWFEVSTRGYKFFDANDPAIAPHGYIARTNFSFTGPEHKGLGYVRYRTDDEALAGAAQSKSIAPDWIFTSLARSFVNPQLGIDLRDGNHNKPKTTGWFIDQDFISRSGTACSAIIQGVRLNENPELTTLWTVLGYPPVSVAFPFWLKDADTLLPSLYTSKPEEVVTLFGKKVDKLKEQVYAFHEGIGSDRYFYWEALYNKDGNGIMQQLAPVEKEIFRMTNETRDKWYKNGKIKSSELKTLYDNLSEYVSQSYQRLFNL